MGVCKLESFVVGCVELYQILHVDVSSKDHIVL